MSYDWRPPHSARFEAERRIRKMPMHHPRTNWRAAAMQASAIVIFGAAGLHVAWQLCRLIGGWL